jgi:hypothetical protein
MYDNNKWNIFNLMTIIGMLEMNYTINELIIFHMCFKNEIMVVTIQQAKKGIRLQRNTIKI